MIDWSVDDLTGVSLQPDTKPKNKFDRRPRRPRTINASLPAQLRSPRWPLEDARLRYQRALNLIASGDLAAIAAEGRHLQSRLAEGGYSLPNVEAQCLEALREAYAFYATGQLPAELA